MNARLFKAIATSVVIYLLADALWSYLLGMLGLGYLHAFLAMFCGMFAGGYVAGRNFIAVAVLLSLAFSLLTYFVVARQREQALLDLILQQHPMISIGSIVGAALGALAGYLLAKRLSSGAVQA